jgi:hypothetical protein
VATVTGKSSTKIDQLIGDTLVGADLDSAGSLTFTKKSGGTINAGTIGRSVVSAVINASKHLIFTKMDGTTVDAGSIIPNVLDSAWPVGSVYFGMTSANPSTLLGGGTWVRLAKGKMIVGVDEEDGFFDAVRETGGSKQRSLSADNVPKHTHTMAHEHPITSRNSALHDGGGEQTSSVASGGGTFAVNAANAAVGPSTQPNTGNNAGTGSAFDIMNPYITTYIWERTA